MLHCWEAVIILGSEGGREGGVGRYFRGRGGGIIVEEGGICEEAMSVKIGNNLSKMAGTVTKENT